MGVVLIVGDLVVREELLLVGEGERNAAQTRGGRPVADLAPWLATTG